MIGRLFVFITLFVSSSFSENPAGASFKEGTGISLSERTRTSIGLKTVEVEERTLTAETEVTAQVYELQSGKYGALASVFISSNEADLIRPGQSVRILSPWPETGTIIRIDQTMNSLSGRSELLIGIPDPEQRLNIGNFIRAVLTGSEKKEVTVIPEDAVLRTAFGNFVFVMNGSAFLRTPIETGARQGGYVEIIDGLYSGDEVVVHSADSLYQIELRATKGGGHCH